MNLKRGECWSLVSAVHDDPDALPTVTSIARIATTISFSKPEYRSRP